MNNQPEIKLTSKILGDKTLDEFISDNLCVLQGINMERPDALKRDPFDLAKEVEIIEPLMLESKHEQPTCPKKQSIYSAWCAVCNICVSWPGRPSKNGWDEMYPWLYQSLQIHAENCNGAFEVSEDKGYKDEQST